MNEGFTYLQDAGAGFGKLLQSYRWYTTTFYTFPDASIALSCLRVACMTSVRGYDR